MGKNLTGQELFELMDKMSPFHALSYNNKEALSQSDRCGCFWCCEIYSPQKIKEWTDEGLTAICPQCSIDSIIAETPELPLNEEFLENMHTAFFSAGIDVNTGEIDFYPRPGKQK